VYRDHCPDDPTCRAFGFVDRQGTPSAMMRRSLLYNLHGRGIRPDVVVSEDRFMEVFRSMYGKVRIYKIIGIAEESKQWVLDHRQCDVKGSWFCPGKYPPGLKPFLEKNYFKDLQNPEFARKKIMEKEYRERKEKKKDTVTDSDKDEETRLKQQMYKTWEDSEAA
jgi:dolichyl-diphosphooligosaccharide---protein glycosyltransferase